MRPGKGQAGTGSLIDELSTYSREVEERGGAEEMRGLVESLKERRRVSVRPFLLGELLVAFLLLRVYDMVRSYESVREVPALDNGRALLAIEKVLHLNIEYDANHWLAHHHTLAMLLVWWYQYSHTAGTMSVLVVCYLFFPRIYRSARTGLVLTSCIGFLVFVVLPVMPPRLLPHAGFLDTVARAGYGTDHGGPIEPAMYGAMPSLHVAWALWVGILLFVMLRGKPHRGLAFIYPALTTVAVITTANHYVLDVVCGVAVTVIALTVSGFFAATRAQAVDVPAGVPVPEAARPSGTVRQGMATPQEAVASVPETVPTIPERVLPTIPERVLPTGPERVPTGPAGGTPAATPTGSGAKSRT